jgi:NADH:ubiquinone oxidoreductase subunit H
VPLAELLAKTGVSIINDLFTSFWFVLVVKAVLVLLVFLSGPMVVGYMEHKVLAHMQHRLGPMYAGRFHGWAQLIADGVKFVQKEDLVPSAADRWVFALAPAVAMIPYILLFAVIPFDDSFFAENLDVGIFYVLAASSISVIGILMAGWASANKFSLIGALRAAAQLIAYELPLILAASAVVMQAGTLSLIGIAEAQQKYWFVFPQIVGFGIFMVASLSWRSPPSRPCCTSAATRRCRASRSSRDGCSCRERSAACRSSSSGCGPPIRGSARTSCSGSPGLSSSPWPSPTSC